MCCHVAHRLCQSTVQLEGSMCVLQNKGKGTPRCFIERDNNGDDDD